RASRESVGASAGFSLWSGAEEVLRRRDPRRLPDSVERAREYGGDAPTGPACRGSHPAPAVADQLAWTHSRGMIEDQEAQTDSRTIAFLVAGEGIERVELTEPWDAVTDAGHTPVLVSTSSGEAGLVDHLTAAGTQPVDRTTGEATAADIDVLVLP